MWPLPQLPTDQLYKFHTFIGLAMIIASFYVLFSKEKPFNETGAGAYTQVLFLTDQLVDAGLSPKTLPDDLTDENPMGRYLEYRDLIRGLPDTNSKREELRLKNEQLLVHLLNNLHLNDYTTQYKHAFWWLFFSGWAFLGVGLWWWTLEDSHQKELRHLETRLRILESRANVTHKATENAGS
ncbi:hypothetical protein [Agrobacterium pusense]|uniref:Uncharacterized protein n=1 Tax=Agrobacterium pusense TaxID=648995 RepID=A0A6H0ZLD1_9HYPH|nr:hypothetical protein [Agrobacterium pusense]QIX20580.1 hypothetical protein FOB41_05220 [Agrobacterium pusense]WCK25331.1 hypothetical protein CFBP5496_0007080 [Agrobacterium pusense]